MVKVSTTKPVHVELFTTCRVISYDYIFSVKKIKYIFCRYIYNSFYIMAGDFCFVSFGLKAKRLRVFDTAVVSFNLENNSNLEMIFDVISENIYLLSIK